MLTIYGVYRSRATRTLWLAGELGIAYKHVPVIQAGRLADPLAEGAQINTRSPEFLAINPRGHIPTIEDDGLVLSESMAINLYLARKHGGDLAPKDLAEEATITGLSFFAATEIEANALKISATVAGGKQDSDEGKAVIETALQALERPFGALEQALSGTDYLVGGRFTVADLNVAEVVRYAQSQTAFFEKFPHVKAWLERCQARPAFKDMWEKRTNEAV